ncbi:class I SAM-dependent methyltransferase [Parvularcula sp. LCG005]|uniref:class I SAM-dependent methyltransferase n=1 Tax=Parvularcula sp. LCG005 TaxID=3078805 RepID=UPI002942EF52|nr:methyltransferase domain-containing protein [Parvularcula sp. LCG005]WOI52872.1 methyltransferase domain-containing protein [Parvularcula sp. LCG005]
MRQAASDLEEFYASPLGALVAGVVTDKLVQAWGTADRLRVAGYGYAQPFLGGFTGTERKFALVPEGTGVRAGGDIPACLVHEHCWPLPDASLDRLFIIHGLEEGPDPRRLLREAWRVLSNDGLLIMAATNRRGLWSMTESTPFAAGRPFSRRQLDTLLTEGMFAPTAHATSLHFPPFKQVSLLPLARTWERLGEHIEGWRLPMLLPNLAGLNLVEARKSTAVPISGTKAEAFRPGMLVPSGLRPASPIQGRDSTKRAASARQLGQNGADGSKRLGDAP